MKTVDIIAGERHIHIHIWPEDSMPQFVISLAVLILALGFACYLCPDLVAKI